MRCKKTRPEQERASERASDKTDRDGNENSAGDVGGGGSHDDSRCYAEKYYMKVPEQRRND